MVPPPWANKQQAPQAQQQQVPQKIAAPAQPQQPQSQESQQATKADYCPQVVPRQALTSGAKNVDPSVPDLAELKQRAQAGRRKWTEEALRATDALIPLQNGTNRWFSQKGMTGFGTPRDVNGKHVHRLVDEMFPDAASQYQQEPNRFLQDKSDY